MTAFDIYRGSITLSLPALYQLILAQITVEMLHGLYHAPLPDNVYSRLIGDEWNTMVKLGCRCSTCAHNVPLVLQFAREPNILNELLERGARRAIVGLFGEDFLPVKPLNILPLLFEAENALANLKFPDDPIKEQFVSNVRPRILSVRESIDRALCANVDACLECEEWKSIQKADKSGDIYLRATFFEQANWVLQAILRGANQQNVLELYRALAYSTNPHMNGFSAVDGFSIRQQIEGTRVELLKVMSLVSLLPPPFQPIPPLDLTEVESLRSFSTSFYSCISTPNRVPSLDETTNTRYDAHVGALDLATTSLCSQAYSRTISTEYGAYYTRRAFSIETGSDRRSVRRRRSWNSFRTFEWDQ
ncbi:hypothetical protein GALMADRAFT_247000 [Galerina marginata CBS 339.88]|uniref:Uncharacterized protein n=1 Tax=Galerina marginata (strain CBS 339.88) TaxID=685588 RepID=A0A067TC71_GALM3|nr:hypothetical protein GALMADRAFT_247000 [Galerina marginata CBS 339.88]